MSTLIIKILKDVDKVLSKEQIFDLGPKSRMKYHDIILKSDSILWNGPLGKFEVEPFDAGTKYILGAIKTKKSKNFFSVSGGGDTISMLKKLKYFLTIFLMYQQVVEHFLNLFKELNYPD